MRKFLFFFKSSDLGFRCKKVFFCSFWLIFYPLEWIVIFLRIWIQEAKILRIRILSTAFKKLFLKIGKNGHEKATFLSLYSVKWTLKIQSKWCSKKGEGGEWFFKKIHTPAITSLFVTAPWGEELHLRGSGV